MKRKLALPGFIWLLVFFGIPFFVMFLISFASRSNTALIVFWPPSFSNYIKAFDPIHFTAIATSLKFSTLTTLFCVLLGFPLALFITRQRGSVRALLLFLVMLPFFTNFLARTYAWFAILRSEGILNAVFNYFGWELTLLNTDAGIILGMIYGYLPLMVLPLYSTLEKIDTCVLEAAHDLGANAFQTLRRVILPLSYPGLVSGCVLVFIPTLGEFLVPKMLGGGKTMVLGTLIEQQFLGRMQSNWPFGAALTVLLMLAVIPVLTVHIRQERKGNT